MTDLGTLAGDDVQSEARGINDRGQVVGTSVAPDGQFHGFVWRDGRMTDLGIAFPDVMNGSGATDINDNGLIVGHSAVAADTVHAVLWTSS